MRGALSVALALLPAAAGYTVNNIPQGGLFIQSPTQSAFNYTDESFQCQQPTTSLTVNETHVWIVVTSYSQTAGDTISPHGHAGRTQFTIGTLLNATALPAAPIWDATSAPTSANAFASVHDRFLFQGSCGLGANFADVSEAGQTAFPGVSSFTVAPEVASGAHWTPDLASGATTMQTIGCDCPAYALDASNNVIDLTLTNGLTTGGLYPCSTADGLADTSADDAAGGARRIFYTHHGNAFNGRAPANMPGQLGDQQANTTNKWALRQTTCGATTGDSCDGTVPQAFSGVAITGATCSLKTEALLVLPIEQFLVHMKENGAIVQTSASSSTLSYRWQTFSVEYASTVPFPVPANGGADAFETRVTPTSFSLDLYPSGAVVQVLPTGDIAAPLLLHTTATGSNGAIAMQQRTSANELTIVWQFAAYVQQSQAYKTANARRSLLSLAPADTLLMDSLMKLGDKTDVTDSPQLIFGGAHASDYSYTCDTWYGDKDQGTGGDSTIPATLSSYANGTITSGYSCADAANSKCRPFPQTALPANLLAYLSAGALANAPFWQEYYITVSCKITASGASAPGSLSADFNLPATTIEMNYRLADTSDTELTDHFTPPFTQIVQVAYTSPGLKSATVSFDLTGSIVQLNESVIATSETLSDMIYATENNVAFGSAGAPNQVAYSEAIAFKVELTDKSARDYWQVMPALVLMVAFDTTQGAAVAASSTTTSASSQLPASWCGLDQDNLVGAWAVVDTRVSSEGMAVADSTNSYLFNYRFDTSAGATVGAVTQLGPAYNNIADSMSDGLKAEVAAVLAQNRYNDIAGLQYNIAPTGNLSSQLQTTIAGGTKSDYLTNVATVTDATGGFALPVRNRFVTDGFIGGYELAFCTIAQVVPYFPLAIGVAASAMYPAYTTAAAARADTLAVRGTVYDPIAVYGIDLGSGQQSNWLKFYIPAMPASTGGVVCMKASLQTGPTGAKWAAVAEDVTFQEPTSAACAANIVRSQATISDSVPGAGAASCAELTNTIYNLAIGACVCQCGYMDDNGYVGGDPKVILANGGCATPNPNAVCPGGNPSTSSTDGGLLIGRRMLAITTPVTTLKHSAAKPFAVATTAAQASVTKKPLQTIYSGVKIQPEKFVTAAAFSNPNPPAPPPASPPPPSPSPPPPSPSPPPPPPSPPPVIVVPVVDTNTQSSVKNINTYSLVAMVFSVIAAAFVLIISVLLCVTQCGAFRSTVGFGQRTVHYVPVNKPSYHAGGRMMGVNMRA